VIVIVVLNIPIILHRKLDCLCARADAWAPYARRGHLTLGKTGNTTAEQTNAVFARAMDGYVVLPFLTPRESVLPPSLSLTTHQSQQGAFTGGGLSAMHGDRDGAASGRAAVVRQVHCMFLLS